MNVSLTDSTVNRFCAAKFRYESMRLPTEYFLDGLDSPSSQFPDTRSAATGSQHIRPDDNSNGFVTREEATDAIERQFSVIDSNSVWGRGAANSRYHQRCVRQGKKNCS